MNIFNRLQQFRMIMSLALYRIKNLVWKNRVGIIKKEKTVHWRIVFIPMEFLSRIPSERQKDKKRLHDIELYFHE